MFPNLLNARDLGGHLTVDGKQTQMKAFVRSDLPNCLTPEGVQAVVDYRTQGCYRKPALPARICPEDARSPDNKIWRCQTLSHNHWLVNHWN